MSASPQSKTPVAARQWQAQLRQLKLRATPARLAILNLLETAGRPLSIQRIVAQLHSDPATVYRTLNTLREYGLVRHIDWHHGHAHFELTSLGDHHHVVCTRCRAVADVSCRTSAAMLKTALDESGFAAINEHSIEFFGLCRACQPR